MYHETKYCQEQPIYCARLADGVSQGLLPVIACVYTCMKTHSSTSVDGGGGPAIPIHVMCGSDGMSSLHTGVMPHQVGKVR